MTAECKTKRNKSACVDSFDIIGMYDNQCQVIERKKERKQEREKNGQKRNQQHLWLKRIESVHKSVNNASIITPTRG